MESNVAPPSLPLPADLKMRLLAVRNGYWIASVLTGVSILAGAIGILIPAQGGIDWWFGLPWIVRALLLGLDVTLLVFLYRRFLRAALHKRTTLPETALLIEKKWPHLQQGLLTAVELAQEKSSATHGSLELVAVLQERARTRTLNLRFKDVIPIRYAAFVGGCALIISVATLVILVTAWPGSCALLKRMILLNVPRPPKTVIVPVTKNMIVATGSEVRLSVRAERIIPAQGRVIITPGDKSQRPYAMDVIRDKNDTFTTTIPNVQEKFTYSFQLNDSQSQEYLIRPQQPPAIATLDCVEVFPDYTKLAPQKLVPTALSVLMGSHLKIHARTTKQVKSATVILRGTEGTIFPSLHKTGLELDADIPIPTNGLTGFSVHLADIDGVGSVEDAIYAIKPYPDRPPTLKLLDPKWKRQTITMRAKPPFVLDVSDDFGLSKLTLNLLLTGNPPGLGEAPSPPQKVSLPLTIKSTAEGIRYNYTLDPALQIPAWQTGQRVEYWIEAVDNNNVTGPGITVSAHKQFIIVTQAQKEVEIRRRLGLRARDVDRLSEAQADASEDVMEAILQSGTAVQSPGQERSEH